MKRIYGSARGEVISQKLCQSNTKFIYTNKLFENKYEVIETFPTAIVAGIFPDIFPNKYKIKGKNIKLCFTSYNENDCFLMASPIINIKRVINLEYNVVIRFLQGN